MEPKNAEDSRVVSKDVARRRGRQPRERDEYAAAQEQVGAKVRKHETSRVRVAFLRRMQVSEKKRRQEQLPFGGFRVLRLP